MEQDEPQRCEIESPNLGAASPEELEFAQLVVECGSIKGAAEKMWPDVSQNERKAHRWLKNPIVKAAIASMAASKAAENLTQVRIWFEMCGLGLPERIRIVADLIKDPKTGRNVKVDLLKYADELEGRATKAKNEGPTVGLLEAFVLGNMSGVAKGAQKALPPVQDAEEVEEECQDARGTAN